MSGTASSTIAALCYARQTNLDFSVLTDELSLALRENPRVDCRVTTQYEDFVVFDLTEVRICLAYCNFAKDFPELDDAQRYAESLVISVGSRPGQDTAGPLFDSRAELCRGLVERVESHHPSDRFLLMELDESFTENVYDTILEKIWPILADAVKEEEQAVKECPDDILPNLERRFEEEMAQKVGEQERRLDDVSEKPGRRPSRFEKLRQTIRPTHPAMHADKRREEPAVQVMDLAEDAFALPPGFARETMVSDRLRYALYPPMEELPDQVHAKPVAHRVAIYTINASVMAFSLPIGVAMLTYFALGRESLNMAARAMAVTGSIMGVSQTEMATSLISRFV